MEDNLGWRFPYGKKDLGLGPSSFSCSFSIEDLSMKEAPKDYFNHKPIRGSSPTSTLVADLSQNLLIDRRYVLHSWNIQQEILTLEVP